jgi:site-specific recombinase XerD
VAGEVSAMSSLSQHLERYLSVRRALGYRLKAHGRVLPSFVSYAESLGETTVRIESAVAWAARTPSDEEMGRRLTMVRGFARYLTAFDATTEVPPRSLAPGSAVRETPYIYSPEEITELMRAATARRPEAWGATLALLAFLESL